MNLVLLVVDSLRASSLRRFTRSAGEVLPLTPFLDRLAEESICFRRAYATECWTLPSHASMFTGLLPSEHGAHFRSMAYERAAPTLAEILSSAGFHTEVVTRNSIFDGTIPGILRGFQKRTAIFSDRSPWSPLSLALAATKPRFRRQIATSGFFHPGQRRNAGFVKDFARSVLPADHLALDYVLGQMTRHHRAGRPYFLFSNLYDVHAPYPPSEGSIMRPWWPFSGLRENLRMPFVMPCLGAHTYLREGFALPEQDRRMLRDRYHRSIELIDAKLETFFRSAKADGLLDDTVVILTSDHGEAFGEHRLYLHDASVYDIHLHVPLWIHHPWRQPEKIDDVVSLRDLFGLMRGLGLAEPIDETILSPNYRARHCVVLAEHFHYPRAEHAAPRFRHDIAAAICGGHKVIVRNRAVEVYDLARDPGEQHPAPVALGDFERVCRRNGAGIPAVKRAMTHLRGWGEGISVASPDLVTSAGCRA